MEDIILLILVMIVSILQSQVENDYVFNNDKTKTEQEFWISSWSSFHEEKWEDAWKWKSTTFDESRK